MRIAIIGAGNVGSTTALRLAQDEFAEIILVDTAKGLALAKALDLEDARYCLKSSYRITASQDIEEIRRADIIVVAAGLTRKPGMTREDLLLKNAAIIKDIAGKIKELAPQAIVIIVTNPLDLMLRLALKESGFKRGRIFGMGISLDSSRFANLISKELNIPVSEIEPCLIGSHGEGMLPLPRLTKVKGKALNKLLDNDKISSLVDKTIKRGLEIVTLLGQASAYFAPSAAIAEIVRAIAEDEKKIIGVSAYLDGEYGVSDVCIGVPARLGRNGIAEIIELELMLEEKKLFLNSVNQLKQQFNSFPPLSLKDFGGSAEARSAEAETV